MSTWLVEPRDPLVVRDGRPNQGRSESATLAFPLPSTCAGICRTRLGTDPERGFVLGHRLEELRRTSLRGPVLADRDTGALFFAPPRDAWVTRARDGTERIGRLAPVEPPAGIEHDAMGGLALVGASEDSEDARGHGKATTEMPAFWSWPLIERWLRAPAGVDGESMAAIGEAGLPPLPQEARTHVALDDETATAREGLLYGTTGLRFTAAAEGVLSRARSLALLLDFDHDVLSDRRIAAGLAPFGGKRRLARWLPGESSALPEIPAWLRAHVVDGQGTGPLRLRVVLATPAVFRLGHRPTAGESPLLPDDTTARLVAALVPRPETVSGWDFEHRRPKGTRRLVVSGSVFFIDLLGDVRSRIAWLERVWMCNVSDDAQDRRDGFGLALIGVGA
jgi:CRISPR-associated protein Cmr3